MSKEQRKNSEGKAKRLANLKPFKKGESGNPEGRPQGTRNRATVINEMLEKKTKVADPSDPSNRLDVSLYEAMVLGQIKSAMEGNTRAFQEIQDTLFGKLTDKHQLDVDVNLPSPEDLRKKFAERRKAVEALDD